MKKGLSENVQVEVTTDSGAKYFSKPFVLYTRVPKPEIDSNETVFDGLRTVRVAGSISSSLPIESLRYRILYAKTPATEWQYLNLDEEGTFSFSCETELFENGASIIEIQAIDEIGTLSSKGLLVKKIPPVLDPKKANPFDKPSIYWFEGENIYFASVYTGTLSLSSFTINGNADASIDRPVFGQIDFENLSSGDNRFDLSIANEADKLTTSHFTVKRFKSSYTFCICLGYADCFWT